MNHRQLRQIAADMRRELPNTGHAERVLHGTYLALIRRGTRIQLIIGRPDVTPRYEDAAVIGYIFGVPADSSARTFVTKLPAQDGRTIDVRAVAYTWTEQVA